MDTGLSRSPQGRHHDQGNIAKVMRDIDDEDGKNDWVRAIIEVPGVGD
jgi:hypothetical protein